jgi:hypothetical protein
MHRKTNSGDGPAPVPSPPWLAGAAIGLTILGMASSAIVFGAGLALSQAATRLK